MDGIARAISNGVEQHISHKLLINQNNSNNYNNRFEAYNILDADVHQNGIPYQDVPEEPEISESKPAKKSFRELKENVKVFSNGNSKEIYDLNLGNVSAEPTNEQYLRVRECITKILLHYLADDKESELREQLNIDENDEKFTAVLYLTLYLLVRASIMKMKTQGDYIEDTLLALENTVLDLPQIGQWIVDAGKKYGDESEILNNPESDKIIEFLYENSTFNGASDKDIYVALLNFRNDVISYVIGTLKTDLSDLYQEIAEIRKAEEEKQRLEAERLRKEEERKKAQEEQQRLEAERKAEEERRIKAEVEKKEQQERLRCEMKKEENERKSYEYYAVWLVGILLTFFFFGFIFMR